MLNLFRLFQGGGMGGSVILPTAAMDEPVVMMDAFALMADFDARLRDKGGEILDETDTINRELQEDAEAKAMASWLAA